MFILIADYFELNKIYNSGLAFNWKKINDECFIVYHKDTALKISQQKNKLFFECSEQQFFDIWYDYFDFGTDYEMLYWIFKKIPLFERKIVRAKGLHLLKPDLLEAVIFSILEAGPQKSRQLMFNIRQHGEKITKSIRGLGQVSYNKFPTIEQILENKKYLKGFGIKKDVMIYICKEIEKGNFDLEYLKILNYNECLRYLKQFPISSNIAKRICLYGLHKLESFPNDKPIKKMLDKYDVDRKEFFDLFLKDRKGAIDNCGIFYHYVLYNKYNLPKKGNKNGFN